MVELEDERKEIQPTESAKPLDTELLKRWKEEIPQRAFAILDLNLGCPAFRQVFNRALIDGQDNVSADQVVQDVMAVAVADPYEQIYIVLNQASETGGTIEQLAYQHFQLESLAVIEGKLKQFEAEIETSTVPELIKVVYRQKVEATRLLVRLRSALGTPEFTRLQQTNTQWKEFLDLEATTNSGQAALPHEQLARRILENNREVRVYDNVRDALGAIWRLSEKEKTEIGYSNITGRTEKLTVEQGIALFRILLRRAGLENWTVQQYSGSTIKINTQATQILFPDNREMDADETAFIPAHEFVHIISGANGSTQPCSAVESGIEGFQETQEGLAAVAEVIVGQPYGHKRQLLFAARYFAVAQALKVQLDKETGQHTALYSMQDIFNQLIQYRISEKDAGETVWRIFRGTSLTRQVVEIDMSDIDGNKIKVAETFTKDTVYFSGLMKIYEYLMQLIPLSVADREKERIKNAVDFCPTVLAHIGRRVREIMMGSDAKLLMDREGYNYLVELGRTKILELLNSLLVGKLSLEMMTDSKSEWLEFLNRDRLIAYQKIFSPVK